MVTINTCYQQSPDYQMYAFHGNRVEHNRVEFYAQNYALIVVIAP